MSALRALTIEKVEAHTELVLREFERKYKVKLGNDVPEGDWLGQEDIIAIRFCINMT